MIKQTVTKPRISFRRRVWDCKLPDFALTGVVGFGYTPKDAYDDWRRQVHHYQSCHPLRAASLGLWHV